MYCIPAVPSLALSFSTFLPVSVCPFLPQLPYLKNTETKPKKEETQQSPVFLPLLFIISFSFSLSSTNKFVSPYLSTSPSLFLTRFYQPALFILSSHCSLSLFLILPFSLYFPTTDTLSLKTGGLAVHSPRPNTYTHPSDQYFFSCCSPLSYFTPPPTSPPPSSSPLPRHRVACSSTQSLAQYILSHMLRIFTVLFIPIHCTALSCGCSLSFIPPVLLFLHCCLFLSKRLIRVKESADCDKERRVGWRQSEQHRGEERANRGTERESYFRENIMSEGPC